MKKRWISLVLALCMVLTLMPVFSTRAEAYNAAYALPAMTDNQAIDTANVAKSQLGYYYSDGTVYGAWWNTVTNWGVDYTHSGWCAMFACWCANQAGAGLNVAYNKNGANPALLLEWYETNAVADTSFSMSPAIGDFIFFGAYGGTPEHVAIVTGYDSSTRKVSLVGGNQGDGVGRVTSGTCTYSKSTPWGSQYVVGIGRANYSTQGAPDTLTLSDYNTPGTLNVGDKYSIYGIINSGSSISSVTVGVYDASGNMATGKTVNPGSTTYNIHNVDNYILFNYLSAGTYFYRITATNGSGTKQLLNHQFVVKDPPSSNFTVTFDANGGSCDINTKTVTSGSAVGTLPTPTRNHYTFDGWYTAASGGTKISTSTIVNGNVTYYAHWIANVYEIRFDANGGSCDTNSINVSYGEELGTLPSTSRSNYAFEGWYTAADGGTKISSSTTVTGSATYYAHWTLTNCVVTFKSEHNIRDPLSVDVGNVIRRNVYPGNEVGRLPDEYPGTQPDKYRLIGWFTEENGQGERISEDTKIDGDVTFYAYWTDGAVCEVEGGNLYLNAQWEVIGCDDTVTNLVIPETVDGEPVSAIKSSAFKNNQNLNSVVIPGNVESIGSYAFRGCTNLESVTLSEGIRWIDDHAFYGCESLENISCPKSLNAIEDAAFMYSGLKSAEISGDIGASAFSQCTNLEFVELLSTVTSIGGHAFDYCISLESIIIPSSVKTISNRGVFELCEKLSRIDVSTSNPYYSSEGGVLFNKDKTTIISFPAGKSGEYKIPDSVTVIDSYAFSDCKRITSIEMPSAVKTIGDYAFQRCEEIKQLALPETVQSIGEGAFFACDKLNSINLPDGIQEIKSSTFSSCSSLSSIVIPEGVTKIGNYVFSNTRVSTINIPISVTSIGSRFLPYNNGERHKVYYGGTKSQWQTVTITGDNEYLLNAMMYFAPCWDKHTWDEGVITKQPSETEKGEKVYTCSVCGETETREVPYTAELAITKQPVDFVGEEDSPVTFTVEATGEGLTYKWQFSDNGGKKWTTSSIKTAEYVTMLAANRDGRQIRCIVTDKNGNSVTSNVVTMRLYKLAITKQPENYVGAEDSPVTFRVEAIGEGLSYKWQFSDNGGQKWTTSSIKTAEYPTLLAANRDGRLIRCIVKDQYGNSVTSDVVTMRLYKLAITKQPVDFMGKENSPVTFYVEAAGDGLTYQWQFSDNGGKKWTKSSVKTAEYATMLAANRDGRQIRCIVKDQYGNSVTSDVVTMRLYKLAITKQPVDYVGKVNSTASFTVEAIGVGLTYKWQYSDNGGAKWTTSSVSTPTYSARLTSAKNGRLVRCIVTDAYDKMIISDAVAMRVGAFQILEQPQSVVAKENTTVTFKVAAAGEGLTYKWQYSDNGGQKWTTSSVTAQIYSARLTSIKNGRLVRCIITDANGNSVTSGAARMTIG